VDDVTLTITIERPKPDKPDGYISMTAKSQAAHEPHPRFEDAADGPCNRHTMTRVFRDLFAYLETGRKHAAPTSFTERFRRGNDGHSR
jgi:hypothetical protein